MYFIVNGVIRSLSNKERISELKQLLLGKKINIDSSNSFEINEISLSSHMIVFYGKDSSFQISKVKKIEIDSQSHKIRITNNSTQYIIPLI